MITYYKITIYTQRLSDTLEWADYGIPLTTNCDTLDEVTAFLHRRYYQRSEPESQAVDNDLTRVYRYYDAAMVRLRDTVTITLVTEKLVALPGDNFGIDKAVIDKAEQDGLIGWALNGTRYQHFYAFDRGSLCDMSHRLPKDRKTLYLTEWPTCALCRELRPAFSEGKFDRYSAYRIEKDEPNSKEQQ